MRKKLFFSFLAVVSLGIVLPKIQQHAAGFSATNPSGEVMPVGDIPGWHQIFTDDFTTNVPLGSFPTAIADKWEAYPDGWKDTSKNGTYYPSKVISMQNGVMNLYLHTENGVHMVAAPEPKLPNAPGKEGGLLYGRYVIRFKSDPVPGYKTAWLLWPDSENWPQDGEIDFPEGDLTSTIDAFMHRQNGTSGADQDAFSINTPYTSWHTAIIEWSPTKINFILDGKIIGSSTNRIPNTPMHWVIQTETALDGSPPNNTAAGNVQLDWVAVYTATIASGQTSLSVTVCPHGLGNCGDNMSPQGGNTMPKHTTQTVTLTIMNASGTQLGNEQGTLTYNPSAQNFQGIIPVTNLTNGNYLVSVKLNGFLSKQIAGIVSVTQGQVTKLPEVTVVNGDINNDNQLDIADYNLLQSCFGSKLTSSSCLAPTTTQNTGADLNDDGQVDGGDYNLFLRELSVQAGQ